jgi:hypothetical protein
MTLFIALFFICLAPFAGLFWLARKYAARPAQITLCDAQNDREMIQRTHADDAPPVLAPNKIVQLHFVGRPVNDKGPRN